MEIYETVPDHAYEEERNKIITKKQKVWDYLKEQTKPVTARKIAENTGLPSGGTQVEVRNIITILIETDNKPIVSVSKGFMVANSKEQLLFYANSLSERMQGIRRRRDAVLKIAEFF